MDGKLRKWLPTRQGIQQSRGKNGPQRATKEREQESLCKQLPENLPAACADGQANGQFAAAVGCASRKEAGEVGTGRQEHEKRKQHDARKEGPRRTAKLVAHQSWLYQPRVQAVVVGILPRQFVCNGVEVISGLHGSDTGPEPSKNPEVVHCPAGQKIGALVVRAVNDGHPKIRPKENDCSMKRGWGDSDNGKGMLVYVHNGPHDMGVGIEMSAPKIVA